MAAEAFQNHLAKNLKLSLHWVLLLCTVSGVGFGVSRFLLSLGLTSMTLRNLIVMPLSYGFFLGIMRLWVEFLRKRTPEIFSTYEYEENLEITQSEKPKDPIRKSRWYDGGADVIGASEAAM